MINWPCNAEQLGKCRGTTELHATKICLLRSIHIQNPAIPIFSNGTSDNSDNSNNSDAFYAYPMSVNLWYEIGIIGILTEKIRIYRNLQDSG